MKISRNDKCPCGSGKKYKNCCIYKDSSNSFSIQTAIKILEEGLTKNSTLVEGGKDWHIKEIKYLNGQSLLIEYYTDKRNPMDIKIEMGEIISFAASFINNNGLETNLFDEIPKFFAIRAYNQSNEQLLYVMSSSESALEMAKGNPLEWLKNSHFEDTTSEFLLQNAKGKISTIEKALRRLIFSVLNSKYGSQWINKINNKDYKNMFGMYKKATGNNSVSSIEILDYSFLPNLKDIIQNNFSDFQQYFSSKVDFENNLNKLNKIRRDESHNREISPSTYKDLEIIYDAILQKIVTIDDSIVPKYAIDNWHIQLYRIVDQMRSSIPQLEESDRDNNEKIFDSFRKYRQAVKYAIKELSNVLVPLSKKALHNELFDLLNDLYETLTKMLKFGEKLEVKKLEKYFVHYNEVMDKIKGYSLTYLYSEV